MKEITDKNGRRIFKVRCPNPKCPYLHSSHDGAYTYYLSVFQEPEKETCPMCNYFGKFEEFHIPEDNGK